jgi:hypothetical protein
MSERDMQRLLELVARHLGAGWVENAEWLRELPANSIDEIERRLVRGDIAGVVAEVEQSARAFAARSHATYVQSGQRAAEWLDDQPQVAERLIRFDQTSERAIRAAQRNELEWVSGISQDTRETVRAVMVDGAKRGANPREMARDIRDSIGLTPNQHEYVANYRRALEQGDWSRALGYELRDGRSDRTMARLARDGGQMPPEQVDKLVETYRQNQVNWRAENIARTESQRQVHRGIEESFAQAIERGDIEADQLVREWIAGPRTRHARPQHQAMNGQTRRYNEAFVAPDGTQLMWPGQGPVEHVAQCRCTTATTLRG